MTNQLSDFTKGMRVRIINTRFENHRSYIGKTGTVLQAVKRSGLVKIILDDGDQYAAFPYNLERL